jgi:UDP-N-acetylglucosamine--N-acetylmuramyl-(pentapeptide) pyrophosphoryl-undecaprenol N-acetylglucosamine transferase
MKTKPRFIISGGGTGGHIFPALSIADSLKERYPQATILFVGAEGRMEMQRVPAAGYRIVGLPIKGFDRAYLLKNIGVLVLLGKSLFLAWRTIRRFRPDVVIGVGGYASGPTLFIASLDGIPTLIQEQNSYAGVTNRLLGRRATTICVAYEGMEKFFPANKIILTGNPVRKRLSKQQDRKEAAAYFGIDPQKRTLLVVGGSLGARTINVSVELSLSAIKEAGIQLIWQTGKNYSFGGKEIEGFWISPFIDRMEYAYATADLVVSRAGAGTISELCLLGKASILIPSPNVAEDHQTKNARALVEKGATALVPDGEAGKELIPLALRLIQDEGRLEGLRNNIASLGIGNSAEKIVNAVETIYFQRRKP